MTQALVLLVTGAAAGLFGSLLGLGGGVFLVPVLVLFLGVDMAHAAGASLTAVIATSSAAASVYVDRGVANMKLGVVLETATVLGAICGGVSAGLLPARALVGLFGAVLVAATAALLSSRPEAGDGPEEPGGGPLDGEYFDPALGRRVRYRVRRLPAGLSASFVAGGLSGLLGIGGGLVKVPALHLFCGMPMKASAATSNYTIGVTAAAGAIVYFNQGMLDPDLCGITVLGVLGGSWAGTALSPRIKGRTLRRLFSAVTALMAVQMLRRALSGG